MNRQLALISALVALLLVVLFWLLLWRPQSERIAEIDAERESVEQQQVTLRQRITRLEDVRRDAPDYEARIVAAESIVPREVAMAAAIRQLQTAADDAAVELVSIVPGRPAQVEEAPEGLAAIAVSLEVNGEYFELVDFLLRIEDPATTVRGFVWQTMAVGPLEYPDLTLNVSGAMYALLPTAEDVERATPPPEPGEEPDEAPEETPEQDEDQAGTP